MLGFIYLKLIYWTLDLQETPMTSQIRQPSALKNSESIGRDAWVEIDLNKLESNLRIIKAHLAEQAEIAKLAMPQIMGVVKADAYGHGAVRIAEVLAACGVSWLGVASADEAAELRESNCKLPILILGPTPSWAAKKAIEQKLDLTVSSLQQLQALTQLAKGSQQAIRIHLKVNTGMHRLGMNAEDTQKAIAILKENKKFKLVSVFSHLAKASNHGTTIWQKKKFDTFIDLFKSANYEPEILHLACSEAADLFPETYYDMVRIGMHLYGLEENIVSNKLMPIMSVRGRINQTSEINKGEAVGYGLTWEAKRPSRLANIPVGYADGVDRKLSNKMKALLHNSSINQVGRISMDQMLFDITDLPHAKEGDVITLIGSDEYALQNESEKSDQINTLYLTDWANQLGTMSRELACRLKARLPRIYTRKELNKQIHNQSFVPTRR